MVKHTQTIHRMLPTNCLSVFDHFVGLAVKELTHFWPVFIFDQPLKKISKLLVFCYFLKGI